MLGAHAVPPGSPGHLGRAGAVRGTGWGWGGWPFCGRCGDSTVTLGMVSFRSGRISQCPESGPGRQGPPPVNAHPNPGAANTAWPAWPSSLLKCPVSLTPRVPLLTLNSMPAPQTFAGD